MREHAQVVSNDIAITHGTAIQITNLSGRTVLRLKSWLSEVEDDGNAVVAAGQTLPLQVGTTVSDPFRVLCVGRGDWLVLSAEEGVSQLRERFEPDLGGHGIAIVDLSNGLTGVELRGTAAPEV